LLSRTTKGDKKMKRKVVSSHALPTNIPVSFTISLFLLLDKFQAPAWAFGAFWTLAVLFWLAAIYKVFADEYVDIFEGEK
jgi:hypothetical protein